MDSEYRLKETVEGFVLEHVEHYEYLTEGGEKTKVAWDDRDHGWVGTKQ